MKMDRNYNKVKVKWMVRVLIVVFAIQGSLFTAFAQRMDNVAEHSKIVFFGQI